MKEFEKLRAEGTLRTIEFVLNLRYHLQEIEGFEFIEQLRQEQHDSARPFPMIFAFNHIGRPETIWVTRLAMNVLEGDSSRIILPVSDDYTSFITYPLYAVIVRVADKLGSIETLPIVQSYRTRDDRLTEEQILQLESRASTLNLSLMRRLIDGFQEGRCLLLAPEGHRSKNFSLQPAEAGIGYAVKLLAALQAGEKIPTARIVPIGIRPVDKGPERTFTMKVGAPLFPQDLLKAAENLARNYGIEWDKKSQSALPSHALMIKIAALLPKEMWGVYDPESENFKKALRGDLQLSKRGGAVVIFDRSGVNT